MPPLYNVCQILDKGVFPKQWTSYRLRAETIYFTTNASQFELKRYMPDHPKYRKGRNYCLSRVEENTTVTIKKQVLPVIGMMNRYHWITRV